MIMNKDQIEKEVTSPKEALRLIIALSLDKKNTIEDIQEVARVGLREN